MGFKTKQVKHVYPVYYNPFGNYHAYCGIFGKGEYFFLLRSDGHKLYLDKYRFPTTKLYSALIYDNGDEWIAPCGAGAIVKNRLYFFNQATLQVEWIKYQNTIPDNPERHPILSVGYDEDDLMFYHTAPRAWSLVPYKDEFLFHIDGKANRVLVTDLDGNFLGSFGEYGILDGQFRLPLHGAIYHSPRFGDVLFVADRDNYRVVVWQIQSIIPFKVLFLKVVIDGLTGDYKPHGLGVWRNQLYISTYKGYIREYIIRDDLSLEYKNETSYTGVSDSCDQGLGLHADSNRIAVLMHEYETGSHDSVNGTICSCVVSAEENTMEGIVGFEGFIRIAGVWHNIPFLLRAGQQGVCKPILFSLSAEGYQQINNMISGFKFAGYVKHDVCAVIQSIPFSIKVRQRQIEESLPFSFLGHCNYMLGSAQLSLIVDIISNIFLSGENVFTFNMIANSPLTFKTELTLEVPEAEGTLVNDTIALFNLILPELILLIQQAFKVECELSCIQPSGKLASPSYMFSTLSLFPLQLRSSMEVPHSFSGQAVLNIPSITALSYQPDLLNADIVLSSLKTNGIAYQGFDYAEMELTIELLSVSSQMAVIPLFHALISLPTLEIDAHEGGQIASIEEIYQNSSLTLASGEYPQVDGVELLGVAINLLNKSISRIANTDYMIIDLGYLDLHKGVVNQYLEVFISGYTPNQNQPIGELQIGSYTYLIEEWVTENEWRVLIGKGLTRKTAQNADKRFIPIKLKLKPDFELRSVTIRATPVARRGR